LVTRDDLTFGSRSGIQKAVRRGDLDLASACFRALWSEKQHRDWLRWRITSIVQEDCLPLIGELASFLKTARDLPKDSDEEKEAWRKTVYRAVLFPAQKDASALATLCEKGYKSKHPEFVAAAHFSKIIEADGYAAAADDAVEWAEKKRELSPYERDALSLLQKRAAAGGMPGDRHISVVAIPIVVLRGLDPDTVLAASKRGVEAWRAKTGRSKPSPVSLPWYCFDMHTQAGKIAMSALLRREKWDKGDLQHLWFNYESALLPSWHIEWGEVTKNPPITQCVWWPEKMRFRAESRKSTVKDELAQWRESWKPRVKGMVEYILRVREER
jgi:hypothetical protein